MVALLFEAAAITLIVVGMGGWIFVMGYCFGPGSDDRWCGLCWSGRCPKCRQLQAAKRERDADHAT